MPENKQETAGRLVDVLVRFQRCAPEQTVLVLPSEETSFVAALRERGVRDIRLLDEFTGGVAKFDLALSCPRTDKLLDVDSAIASLIESARGRLRNPDSSVALVLPAGILARGAGGKLKRRALEGFSTAIIYQDNQRWFGCDTPRCFAVFTNGAGGLAGKALLVYEQFSEAGSFVLKKTLPMGRLLDEELDPQAHFCRRAPAST